MSRPLLHFVRRLALGLPLALVLPAATACSANITAPDGLERDAELPVRKVVLYQNGVGYFERRGQLKAGQIELRVRPDQINDVLKSLSVLDLNGGMASSVSLPVERSGDRLAAELPAQVRNATGMRGLLAVLRGAEVEVEGDDGTMRGRVVGIEVGAKEASGPGDGKQQPEEILTLMAGEDQLLTTRLGGIKRVTIGDRTLAVGLQHSLDISRSEGAWKPVKLLVRLAGDETHDLILSYIHEVPIWRPAYRAWVEKDKGVQLQGWAIVDNVSGEDWKDVDLTLVVGSPLSFRYNLHTPHNVQRPDLSSRLPQVADAPPEPDVGYEEPPPSPPAAEAADESRGYMGSGKGGGGSGQGRYGAPKAMPAPAPPRAYAEKKMAERQQAAKADMQQRDRAEEENRREATLRSAQALVQGKEVGALYTYQATTPVTVPDRSAALINIVSRKVEGQDVFLFREPGSGQAPFRAVLLRNGKESALESGPITLYVEGTFAGEGFIGRIGKDETAFVPYARESGFALDLKYDSKVDELRLVRIVDGRVTVQGKRVYTRTVALQSSRDKDAIAYVKLPLTGGAQLVDPPKDLVKTGGEVYVPVAVPARKKAEAKLVEATPVEFIEAGLTSQVLDAFRYYLKGQKVEDAVAGPIRELLALNEQIAAIERDSGNLAQQREILERDAQRIQGNLDSLPPGNVAQKLRGELVAQLDSTGRKLAEVAKRMVENQVKLAAAQEKVRVLLLQISLK
jgi:hypothetical protein